MKTNIKFTRVPGQSTICTLTLKLEFDTADPAGLERFGRAIRELIPEDERAEFLEDWREAGAKAGLGVLVAAPEAKL
jgi:hypothetical protein